MKNIIKLIIGIILIHTAFIACDSKENIDFNTNDIDNFLESVAIIQNGVKPNKISKFSDQNAKIVDERFAFTIELIDFSNSLELHPAYMIDDIEYCDNGSYNDQLANDGIYASVQKFRIINQEENKTSKLNTILINKSDRFKYESQLENHLSNNGYASKERKIKIGCKFRTVTCTETSWWNKCWFGSPCTCIEFYDCDASIEVEL